MLPSRSTFTKSVKVSVAVSKWKLFFIKPRVKVSGQCCLDIGQSQQMLDAIKHVVRDNFSASQCTDALNTVHLLQCKTLNFLSAVPVTVQSLTPVTTRFYSHEAT